MVQKEVLDTHPELHPHGSLKTYLIGFCLSVFLTLVAYFLVLNHAFGYGVVITTILILALVQMCVQLYFFLHVGEEETHPKWYLLAFLFMLLVVFIIVIGSLWIMFNLEERVMPMENMKEMKG